MLKEFRHELMIPSGIRYVIMHHSNDTQEKEKTLRYLKQISNLLPGKIKNIIKKDTFVPFFNVSREFQEDIYKALDSVDFEEYNTKEIIAYFYERAIRYSLGRRTYITSDVIEWTYTSKEFLEETTKNSIIELIENAITENKAGDEVDILNWKTVLKTLKGE